MRSPVASSIELRLRFEIGALARKPRVLDVTSKANERSSFIQRYPGVVAVESLDQIQHVKLREQCDSFDLLWRAGVSHPTVGARRKQLEAAARFPHGLRPTTWKPNPTAEDSRARSPVVRQSINPEG